MNARKFALAAAAAIFISSGASAQATAFDSISTFTDSLNGFCNDLAPALPQNSVIGSAWSDGYIGQLLDLPPHFGIGITAGFNPVPMGAITTLATGLGVDLGDSMEAFRMIGGIPLPSANVNARVGGFILPFDIGVKVGYVPPEAMNALASYIASSGAGMSVDFDYFLAGVDVRYAIFNEKKNFVDLVVGAGVNYLQGGLTIGGLIPETGFTIQEPNGGPTHTIGFTSPDLFLQWESVSADLSAQISKQFLFITPYLGLGVTIGIPAVSTGLSGGTVMFDGHAMTEEEQATVEQLLAQQEQPNPVDGIGNGYVFESKVTKGSDFRVYGGFSLDILIVRLDLNAMYNLVSKNYGGSLGLRFQL